ncbi:MFS transporter [Xenorhabdus bovienii]|uniref:Major facilitator superfamily protein n=1 Tax=Xenorhabdus bovienii str. kraussei Quebec TaxID=1398203 RepID=A0A077PJH3_XENBV|nr:MFS transporter [Xenorhabdus bovienii]MDE9550573.1 MFS transporter [Xenorhabdus bovienii]MDE9553922.1 MFS transporter [Xenorhabdus bovienii]CDH19854.1 Major facilitator superfamily protein [Xenorhabdus bovienii str. kraussei Quebec]
MKKVIFLAIGMFALGFDAYIIAGLVPGISETYQKSASQIGQSVSIFTLCYAISAPLFASLLAGKPIKKVLLTSIVIFGLANALTALSPNFSVFLISRAIAGVGAGLFSPLAVAGSTMLVPIDKKGRALGLTIGGMSMGTVLGVPIGLYIADQFDWQSAMWFVVILSFIAALSILKFLPHVPVTAPPAIKERIAMFLDKRVTITVLITFFASIASLGLYTYLSPLLQDINDSSNLTMYLWAWGLGGLFGSLSIGYLIDYFKKPKILMAFILIILMISVMCIPIMINLSFIKYLPFFIWGAMGWASGAPQQHILLSYQPKHGSAAIALNSSINYLGSSVGAIIGGVVISLGMGTMVLIYFAVFSMVISLGLQFYSMKSNAFKIINTESSQ